MPCCASANMEQRNSLDNPNHVTDKGRSRSFVRFGSDRTSAKWNQPRFLDRFRRSTNRSNAGGDASDLANGDTNLKSFHSQPNLISNFRRSLSRHRSVSRDSNLTAAECTEQLLVASNTCQMRLFRKNKFRKRSFASQQSSSKSYESQSIDSASLCQVAAVIGDSDSDIEDVAGTGDCFQLHIVLHEGRDLVIRDSSGTSDPYVKFKHRGKVLYKSTIIYKTLNPSWKEEFDIFVDSLSTPLVLQVFDHDRFGMDDAMGSVTIDLTTLKSKTACELTLNLADTDADAYMGYISLSLRISAVSADQRDLVMRQMSRTAAAASTKRKEVAQIWSSILSVKLIEGRNLLPIDNRPNAPLPEVYVKFALGDQKYKSKHATRSLNPRWMETFDFNIMSASKVLEIMLMDRVKNVFMGRVSIDLEAVRQMDARHRYYELDDSAGEILMSLAISESVGCEAIRDLNEGDLDAQVRNSIIRRYDINKSFANFKDVGYLSVKVYRAYNLQSADIGGKSDPFCVLQLVNARLRTHTEYKTLNPEWNKAFTFAVKDINAILEVQVYDEDPNNKAEFLGGIAIPLLKIRNGERKWFALKDRKLRKRTRGQIMIEMEVFYNPLKATIRTFNPAEEKYEEPEIKFKRQIFMRNVNRVKSFAMVAVDAGQFLASIFDWESSFRTVIAFVTFELIVFFFELYMVPFGLVLALFAGYVQRYVLGTKSTLAIVDDEYLDSDEEDDLEDTKEEKKSLKERLQGVQDTLSMVQWVLDYIASMMERVRNTFNFTQPFLSYVLMTVLSIGSIVLYFVPIRWLIMLWGVHKFTKKLRMPYAIPNNEVLDFLSRVPSDTECRAYGELRPEAISTKDNAATSAQDLMLRQRRRGFNESDKMRHASTESR